MGSGINPERIASEIQKQLRGYTKEVQESVLDIAMNVSETVVQKLKEESPKRTGKYAKQWVRTTDRSGVVIYNKAPTYRLTHLLEKGHQLKRGGRKVGEVSANPHIAKIEEECVNEYVTEVERRLGV